MMVLTRGLRYDPQLHSARARKMYTDLDTLFTMLRVAHSPQTFSWRRAAFADGLLSLVGLIGSIDRVAEAIDEVRYPGYHEQPLGKPVYIVAAPRSGTTFLHRMISRDEQFTSLKLYETIFPSITAYEVADRMRAMNGAVGRALTSLRQRIDGSSFSGWAGLHDTGINQDEEDEALWALALSTPAIWLVLPFPERFDYLRFIDRMPREKRDALAAYYRACLQRHAFHHAGKTLLAKNVLLPGRLEIVRQAVPDARFVHIVRHPYEAIASLLSLFTIPWRWHSPSLPLDGKEARAMAQLAMDYYLLLHRESLRSSDATFFNMTYAKLLEDPAARVHEIYEHFGLSMSPSFAAFLREDSEKQRRFKSEHRYSLEQFGLTREIVYGELREVFEHYGFQR